MTRTLRLACFALLAALVAVGCNDGGSSTPTASPTATPTATVTSTPEATATPEPALEGTIVVSAASSLTDVFTEIAAAFVVHHPGVTVDPNFGSSAALASQIVEGAPAHVFASANEAQMKVVTDAGRATGPQTFAQNVIVVATPADNTSVQAFEDVATPGLRLVLAAPDVPVGTYARDALTAAGILDGALANLVSEEANVRAVLSKIELGEADAGIVYATDAAISGDAVRVVEIPSQYAAPAVYPIAVVGDELTEVAQAFVDFVLSAEGQAILAKHGFTGP